MGNLNQKFKLLHKLHELVYIYYPTKPMFTSQWVKLDGFPNYYSDGFIVAYYDLDSPVQAEIVGTEFLSYSDRIKLHVKLLKKLKKFRIRV